MVFLYGNPTSSHLWRNVIPHVSGGARCLAPDLIGMGGSGKPDIGYRFADHARYLDRWLDSVLPDGDLVLVGHDWGGALAQDWAARHDGERLRCHPGYAAPEARTQVILRLVRSGSYRGLLPDDEPG